MHGHPTLGVKNAKPRLSSKPGPQIGKLSEEYLRVRNEQMRLKKLTAEMQLAERRGELIEKRLVEAQAAYLIIAMRQKILNVPQTWCRRLIGVNDAAQVSKILHEMAISILNEIKDLPAKVVDPNWLSTINGDEDGEPIRSSSGQQIKAEAEKAKKRRKQKTETMRKLRAKG
jgi:hypothetical protein